MKIKRGNLWVDGTLSLKRNGGWGVRDRVFCKHSGVWKEVGLRGIKNNLFSSTITVAYGYGDYTASGYNKYGPYGATSTPGTSVKLGTELRYIVTGDKYHNGIKPYHWIELSVWGHVPDKDTVFGDLMINGLYGRFYRALYSSSGDPRTVVIWEFDTPLPTSGQWNVNS